jgi:hypothetical protein
MGCGPGTKPTEINDEKIISRTVRNMEVLWSNNGNRDRMMRAPLMEEHAFAPDAFEEFMEGMEVTGYDSLGRPSSLVVADYALHWVERDLWELNGNVMVEGEEGQKLYTQQLRWDRKIGKIYSNVDSRVEEGGDVLYGVGFEADDNFERWTFLGMTGTVGVDVEPVSDSTSMVQGASETPVSEGAHGTPDVVPAALVAEPSAPAATTPARSIEAPGDVPDTRQTLNPNPQSTEPQATPMTTPAN